MGYFSPIGAWRNITPVEPAYINSLNVSSHTAQVRAIRSGGSTAIPVPKQAKGGFAIGILFGIPLLTLDPESGEYGDNGDTLIFRVTDITPERQNDYMNYLGKAAISIYNMTSGTERFLFTDININYREYVDSSTYTYVQDTTTYSILHKNDDDLYCIGFATNCYIERAPAAHPDRLVYYSQYGQGAVFREDQLPEGYVFKISVGGDDPNKGGGDNDNGEGGGGGSHDRTEDQIPIPDLPDLGAADTGFLTLYRMTNTEIHAFSAEMVDPDVWAAIKQFFMDPMDFIAGIMLVPFMPPSTRRGKPAFFTGSNYFDVISNEFVEIDCGSIAFPLYYNSAFDFNPYSKYTLFLPYIGYVDLDPDDVAGQIINVKYHCDCLTGDCVAFVTKVNPILTQVIAQYSGNCGVRVPYGRTSFDAAISASIQLLGGGIGMAAGAAASALGLEGGNVTAGQIANQVSNATVTAVNGMKVTTERSGVAGASAGYMSIQRPHLIRNIPHQSLPDNYRHLNGYPANIGGALGEFSGYTAVESIELTGINATDEEKAEILSILNGGVFI